MNRTFGSLVSHFFGQYLLNERGASPNTIASYRDAVRLLMTYACGQLNVPPDQLPLTAFSETLILDFLDHLEKKRANGPRTRNHRLAVIRSLFRHLAVQEPELLGLCERLCAIRNKAAATKTIEPLDQPQLHALLRAPDGDGLAAVRDQVLLRLLHNTGARVQELLDLQLTDLQLDTRLQVRLTGKGRKQRHIPLWTETAQAIRHYLLRRDQAGIQSPWLLLNARGQRLTRSGVRYLLGKYTAVAARTCPTLAGRTVTPHTFRHTTALYLVQARVDLPTVKDWLGHADIRTTSHYVTIDLDMKRRALDACPAPEPFLPDANPPPQWQDQKIMRFLNRLSGKTTLCSAR